MHSTRVECIEQSVYGFVEFLFQHLTDILPSSLMHDGVQGSHLPECRSGQHWDLIPARFQPRQGALDGEKLSVWGAPSIKACPDADGPPGAAGVGPLG